MFVLCEIPYEYILFCYSWKSVDVGFMSKFDKLSKYENIIKLGESETGDDVAKVY